MVAVWWLLGLLLPSGVMAGSIVGSPHDFSGQGWSGGEICIACHTPAHRVVVQSDAAPLWNHTVTTLTFTTYGSATLDSVPAQPDGASKLCLSCHDGSVAVDSFGGAVGSNFLVGDLLIGGGGDLTDDHPVSMTYDTTLATIDPGLADPATKIVTVGSGAQQRTGTLASLMAPGGRLQCSSCHDVYNTYTVSGSGGDPLLCITKFGSALCRACHIK